MSLGFALGLAVVDIVDRRWLSWTFGAKRSCIDTSARRTGEFSSRKTTSAFPFRLERMPRGIWIRWYARTPAAPSFKGGRSGKGTKAASNHFTGETEHRTKRTRGSEPERALAVRILACQTVVIGYGRSGRSSGPVRQRVWRSTTRSVRLTTRAGSLIHGLRPDCSSCCPCRRVPRWRTLPNDARCHFGAFEILRPT